MSTTTSTADTDMTAPPLEERQRIVAGVSDILHDLQTRRIAAMREAAQLVKDHLVGTWFHESIEIVGNWPLSEPRLDIDETFENTVLVDPSQAGVFHLFPRHVPNNSADYIIWTVDRLAGGPAPAPQDLPDVDDWDLVHDFNPTFHARVAAELGERWAQSLVRPNMHPSGRLEHLNSDFLDMLVRLPSHRFWDPRTQVFPTIAMRDAFSEQKTRLLIHVTSILRGVSRNTLQSDEHGEDLAVRIGSLASCMNTTEEISSAAANLVWGRIIRELTDNPGGTATLDMVCRVVTEWFPAAAPAVARYKQTIEDHLDLEPAAPMSLDEMFDKTLSDWVDGLAEGEAPQKVQKDSLLRSTAERVLPLGPTETEHEMRKR